jgi:hypothetical protein
VELLEADNTYTGIIRVFFRLLHSHHLYNTMIKTVMSTYDY